MNHVAHDVDLDGGHIILVISPVAIGGEDGAPVTLITTTPEVATVDKGTVALPLSADEARHLLRELIVLYPLDALGSVQ